MEQPALEPARGTTQRADAEQAFLAAVAEGLPEDAWDELRELKPADVVGWARKWRVDAPCVIRETRAILRARPFRRHLVAHRCEIPKAWKREVSRLNGLPLDRWVEDVLAAVLAAPDEAITDPGKRRSEEDWLSANRLALLREDRVLAPVAADPLRESHENFLRRAENHWNGRVDRARQRGYLETRQRPQVFEHAEWLVRHSVAREPTRRIAKSCSRTRQAVEEAIRNVAQLIRFDDRQKQPRRSHVTKRKK